MTYIRIIRFELEKHNIIYIYIYKENGVWRIVEIQLHMR